jgi:hypothetical protein
MKLTGRVGLTLGLIACGMSPAAAQSPVDPTRPLLATPTPEPSFLCGMTIVPAPPAVDQKMSKTSPAGNFTLQVHQPPVCRDMSRAPALSSSRNLRNRLPWFLGPKR